MQKQSEQKDKNLLAVSASILILSSLAIYWTLQIVATISLLELAYGSLQLFNNPLVF